MPFASDGGGVAFDARSRSTSFCAARLSASSSRPKGGVSARVHGPPNAGAESQPS
jgi:hypothetical protein